MMKTRSLMMKKCRNMKNEIKTRWGDSMNLLYCSHIINKSRRSKINVLRFQYTVRIDSDTFTRLKRFGKTNMSPENQWLEDVFPTKIVHFLGHVSFQGCRPTSDIIFPPFFGCDTSTMDCLLVAPREAPAG